MTIVFNETRAEKEEVALWLSGQGDITSAVQRRILANALTFGAALITRQSLGREEFISRN